MDEINLVQVPLLDIPWRDDSKDRKVAKLIRCDWCEKEVDEDQLDLAEWYVLNRESRYFDRFHGGPWHFCSVRCVQQWSAQEHVATERETDGEGRGSSSTEQGQQG